MYWNSHLLPVLCVFIVYLVVCLHVCVLLYNPQGKSCLWIIRLWSCITLLLLEHIASYYSFKMTYACWLMKTRLCWCYLMFTWVVMRTDTKHFEKSCKEQYFCSFPLCSSHTVFKQWCFIQKPSLEVVIEWGSQVVMSSGTVSLKPCKTNLAFITQLLFLAKSCKPGRPIFYLIPLPPTPTPTFSPASRVERISLTSMCWTVYFIFLKCPETEHSSVNK